jgi:hypothetical protein
MAISSISSQNPAPTPQKAAPVEAAEATRGGKDLKNDGDADDAATASAKSAVSAPKPTINPLGQTPGLNLNVTA